MNLLKKIIQKWSELSTAKKSAIAVMAASVLLASFFFISWATKVEYSPLFTNMQPDSAGQVTEKLKEMNVPYKLADQGKTILVPKESVYDLRIQLASDGVFSGGGMGFELFDQSRLGTTEFERQVSYQRALQEELRRTIVQLDAVEEARVHLVLPEESVFIENEGKASCSIAVKLKPFSQLDPARIKGIVQLVANSVKNLDPKDVTIIDMKGNVLSDFITDDFSTGYSTMQLRQLELKRNFERNIEKRIQNLLERMFGSGKVVTMVTAELDFNQKQVTRIEWGDEGVIRSEQIIEKENVSTSEDVTPVGDDNRPDLPQQVIGEPDEEGTDQNQENSYPALQEENESNTSRHAESIKNYEIDKKEEKIIYAPGRLISLSTAVAVDGELSEDNIESIKKIVAAAIGYSPERGDKITVMGMRFNNRQLEETRAQMEKVSIEEQSTKRMNNILSWVLKGLGIILAFILALVLIRTLGSALRGSRTEIKEPVSVQKMEEEIEKKKPKDKETIMQEKAQHLADRKPEEVAQILRSWLTEE